jgi:hypothetical protein
MERRAVTQRDVAEDGATARPVAEGERGSAATDGRLPPTRRRDAEEPRFGSQETRRGPEEAPARQARARQRDEFGGINWGAAIFGWLVAVGIGVILTALVGAAGEATGLTNNFSGSKVHNAAAIGIGGGILLTLIAAIAYFAGGYVAGRMSRFDGARQGLATWVWGLIFTLLIAAAGVIAGSQYNLFGGLNLPRIPVDEGTLTTGGAITLAAVALASLIAAVLGGKAGERYHRRVDEVAYAGDPRYGAGPRHEPAPMT